MAIVGLKRNISNPSTAHKRTESARFDSSRPLCIVETQTKLNGHYSRCLQLIGRDGMIESDACIQQHAIVSSCYEARALMMIPKLATPFSSGHQRSHRSCSSFDLTLLEFCLSTCCTRRATARRHFL